MKTWRYALVWLLWLVAAAAPARPSGPFGKPAPPWADPLRRPGETTVFAFRTAGGKAVSLCKGPRDSYLVYRFGTAAKVELQYPAVLDAGSWQKFSYFAYLRGGGVANAGLATHRLFFRNGGVAYELFDNTSAEAGEHGEEMYLREMGIDITPPKGKSATITGREAAACGSLQMSDEERARLKAEGDE